MMNFFIIINLFNIQLLLITVNCINYGDYNDDQVRKFSYKSDDDDDRPNYYHQSSKRKLLKNKQPEEIQNLPRNEKFKKRKKFEKNLEENEGTINNEGKNRIKLRKNDEKGNLKKFEKTEMDPRNQPISKSYSIIKTTKSELPKDEYYHHSVKYTDNPGKSISRKKSKKHHPKQEIEYVQKTPKKRKFLKGKKNLYDDEESHSSKKAGNYIKPYGYGNDRWDEDERYGDKRHDDDWYKSDKDDDWHGGKRYGDKWHGDKRYGGRRYGDTLYGYGYGDSHDLAKHYGEEVGKKHISDHKAKAGEDISKGYEKEEGYDELQNDKHAKEHNEAEVSVNKGLKKGHVDQAKSRGEEYKGKEGEKGISIVKKGGHKKGKKTSGFHKVHKKDEYKKDIVFYDEAHDGDEHEEHEHEHEQHKEEGGAHGIKGHVDSAYNEEQIHKEGAKKKGEQFEEAEGHKREGGHEEHHDHQSEYEKEAKLKEGEKYGHLEGGVVEGGYSEEEEY